MKKGYEVKILVQGNDQFAEDFAVCIARELDEKSHYKKRSEDKILMTESNGRKTCTIIYDLAGEFMPTPLGKTRLVEWIEQNKHKMGFRLYTAITGGYTDIQFPPFVEDVTLSHFKKIRKVGFGTWMKFCELRDGKFNK